MLSDLAVLLLYVTLICSFFYITNQQADICHFIYISFTGLCNALSQFRCFIHVLQTQT